MPSRRGPVGRACSGLKDVKSGVLSFLLGAFLAVPAAARSPKTEQASALWRRGEVERAAREFEAVFRSDPADRAAALDAATAWGEAGEPKKAAALFAEAAALSPEDADVQAALGWAAGRAGDAAGARKAFDAALAAAPTNI